MGLESGSRNADAAFLRKVTFRPWVFLSTNQEQSVLQMKTKPEQTSCSLPQAVILCAQPVAAGRALKDGAPSNSARWGSPAHRAHI